MSAPTPSAPAAAAPAASAPAAPAATASAAAAETELGEQIAAGDTLDDADSDADSALGSNASSTASLSSSIFAYRELHGRTYNAQRDNEYWAPNDERQGEGLDLLHNAFLMFMDNKLYHAPVADPKRVLDLGTGTGIWAMDVGEAHPGAEVIGTDLSPTQPKFVPPNVRFEVDDCNLDWTWPDNHFDLVFARMLHGSIPSYSDLYKRAFKHLQPGGWLENQEMDFRGVSDHVKYAPGHAFDDWHDVFLRFGTLIGRDFHVAEGHTLRDLMTEAGFVDVHETKVKMPIGGWARDKRLRDAGLLQLAGLSQGLEGYALHPMTQALGMTLDETLVLCSRVRAELKKKSNCAYMIMTVVYGRKPGGAEAT